MLLWEKVVYVWPVSNPLDYVRFCYPSPSLFDQIIQPFLIFLVNDDGAVKEGGWSFNDRGFSWSMHSHTNFDQSYFVEAMTTEWPIQRTTYNSCVPRPNQPHQSLITFRKAANLHVCTYNTMHDLKITVEIHASLINQFHHQVAIGVEGNSLLSSVVYKELIRVFPSNTCHSLMSKVPEI